MGYLEIAQLLLKHGVDVNIRNDDGKTPLFAAAINSHDMIFKWLLANKADPKIEAQDGTTPLFWAEINENFSHNETLRILKEESILNY